MVIRRWSLNIITAARRKFFLANTIRGLRQGGWSEEVRVYAEPKSPRVDMPGVSYVQREVQLGVMENWKSTFIEMQNREPADFYVVMEDDVVVRPNVRTLLDVTCTLPVAVYSVFTPTFVSRRSPDFGWFWQNMGARYVGSQMLVFTPGILPIIMKNMPEDTSELSGFDSHISAVCERNRLPFMCYKPSLSQHVADDVSSIGNQADAATRMAEDYVDSPIMVKSR